MNYPPLTPDQSTAKTLGGISMACGLISFSFFCVTIVMLLLAVTGLVLGIIAIRKGNKAGYTDKAIPVIGIVSSGISLAICLAISIPLLWMATSISDMYGTWQDMQLDSLMRYQDSLHYLDYRYEQEILDEPDSTFFID